MYLQDSNSSSVCLAKKTTSLKKKLIVSLGLILSVLMMLVSFFVVNHNDMTANAETTTTTPTQTEVKTNDAVYVDEIWDNKYARFNTNNLTILLQYIYGGEGDVRPSYIEQMAANRLGVEELNAQVLPAGMYNGVNYTSKTADQDIVVTIAGAKWTPYMLSKVHTGETLLDLKLIEGQEKPDVFEEYINICDYFTDDYNDLGMPQFFHVNLTTVFDKVYNFENAYTIMEKQDNQSGIYELNGVRLIDGFHYKAETQLTDEEKGATLTGSGIYSDNDDTVVRPRAYVEDGSSSSGSSCVLSYAVNNYYSGTYYCSVTDKNANWDARGAEFYVKVYKKSNNSLFRSVTQKVTYSGYLTYEYYVWAEVKLYSISMTSSANTFKLSTTSYTYDGTAKQPTVEVRNNGQVVDTGLYSVSYSSNTNAGTASVTITGIDYNYYSTCYKGKEDGYKKGISSRSTTQKYLSGTKTLTFTINKLNISSSSLTITLGANKTYNAASQSQTISSVKYGSVTIPSSNYYISSGGSGTNAASYTMTIQGQTNLSGSTSKTWSIAKYDIYTATVSYTTSLTYSGKSQTITINSVKIGSNTVPTSNYSLTSGTGTGTDVKNYIAEITGKTNLTGFQDLDWSIVQRNINTCTVTMDEREYTGSSQSPRVSSVVYSGTTIGSSNYTVSGTAQTNVGTYTGGATVTGKTNLTGSVTKDWSIIASDMWTFTFSQTTPYTFNGKAQGPSVTVKIGSTTISSSYYTVSGNSNTAAGKYTVTVKGKTNLSGTKTKQYTISAIPEYNCTIYWSGSSFDYTGSAICPTITSVKIGSTTVSTSYYSVTYSSYENNTNATYDAMATYTFNGGNITGTSTYFFTINQVPLDGCTVTLGDCYYEGSAGHNRCTSSACTYNTHQHNRSADLYYNGILLEGGEDYQYELGANTNAGTAYIHFRAEDYGNFYGTTDVYWTINKLDIGTCKKSYTSGYTYTRSAQGPTSFTLYLNTTSCCTIPSSNYSVSGNSKTNPGDYTLTFTGTSNLTGTNNTSYFTINKRPLSDSVVSISSIPTQTYIAGKIVPSVTVTHAGATLTNSSTGDYTVSCSNNENAGTATLTITAVSTSYYSGSKSTPFTIQSRALDATNFSVSTANASKTYTGSALSSGVTLKYGSNTVSASYYTVTWSNNTNVGRPTIKVTGRTSNNITNITGSAEFSSPMTITAKPLSDSDVALGTLSTCKYNGSSGHSRCGSTCIYNTHGHERSQTLTYNGMTLGSSDRTISYSNNVSKGTATVTYTGKGNYTGTKSDTWTINAFNLSNRASISYSPTSFTYTGSAQGPTSFTVAIQANCCNIPTTNYSVSGNSKTAAGTHTITFTGSTNATGTTNTTFTISPRDIGDATKGALSTCNYNGSSGHSRCSGSGSSYTCYYNTHGHQRSQTLTYNGMTLSSTDYTVSYSNNVSKGTATVTYKAVDGGNYSGSTTTTWSISALPISYTAKSYTSTYTYTGSAQGPSSFTLYLSSTSCCTIPASNYSVSGNSNINANTYTMTFTGVNNLSGTDSSGDTNYTINPRAISATTQSGFGNCTYTGSTGHNRCTSAICYYNTHAHARTQTLTYNGMTLGTADYSYAHSNNVNVSSSATVTYTGKGNYTGSITKTWTISAMDINNVTFEYANSYTYNGSKQGPTSFTAYIVKNCCSVSTSTGYTYAHNGTNQGTYTITFTGSNYLTSTNTKNTFTIKQKSIADSDTTDSTVSVAKGTLSACLGYDTSKGGGHSLCGTNCMYNTHAHERKQTLTYNGMTLDADDYTIEYSNNTLKGTATVTYTGKGNYKGTASRTWTIAALDMSKVNFNYTRDGYTYTTSAIGPEDFTAYLYSTSCCTVAKSGTKGSYSWSGNKAVDVGTYNITFTGSGNLTGTKNTDQYTISPRPISDKDLEVTINPIYQLYKHGTAITIDEFKKVLTLEYNNDAPMAYNTDYSFVLSNHSAVYEDTNYATANPPTVTITGKGNYTGTITRNFLIYANNLNQTTDCKITLPYTTHVYTGHNIEPIVTIKWEGVLYYRDNGGVTQTTIYSSSSPLTLVKGTDYDISYANNQNVGTATITMTGKNRFSGTITRTFNITAADIQYIPQSQITLSQNEYTYTGLANNPTPTVKYQHSNLCATVCGTNRCSGQCYNNCSDDAMKTLANNTDYTYTIENNINAGTALVTITGKGNYTGTNHTSFKIDPRNMSAVEINGLSSAGYPYTGSAITPDFTATYTRATGATPQTLVYMKDYSISYEDNVDAGTATLILTGYGNFTGTQEATFKIIPPVIDDIENDDRLFIESLGSYVYTGSAITPEIHMTFNTKPITMCSCTGTHDAEDCKGGYKIAYSNNTNVGTATITITGVGNFDGTTITRTFEITKKNISDLDVTITYTDRYEHTGLSITPKVTIKYNSNSLSKGTDYNLDVTGNRDVGQGSFTITGKGNYEGSETRYFNIFSYTMDELSATVDTSATTYRGKNVAVKPAITLNDPEAKFTVEYINNYSAGNNATAIITGVYPYTGTIEKKFTISEANIAAASVNAISADAYFTDTEYNPDLRLEFTALNSEGTDTQTTILERDVDFRVKSIEVDTVNFRGVATIEGINNFVGTREIEFNVVARDISTVDVNSLSDVTYTGEEIRPNITLTYSGVKLVEGEDYILEYYDNINSGTAYVDIVGINKFGGIRTLSFTIKQIKLTVNPTFNASEVYYEYDALPQLFDESVAEYGRFEWTPPYFLEGTNDYIWKFVPNDKVNYEVISGEETFTAIDVYVERIITELTGDVDYYAYSEFDKSGIQVTVQYSNNRYQVLEDNQYTISLSEGEYLQAGDELTVYVQEGDMVVGQGMGFAIQARPLTVTFDGYANLTETDSNQTISVNVDGLLEGYEDVYSIVYYNLSNNTIGNSITTAGSYRVEVVLSDSNFAITGSNSVTFNVKTQALSNETVSITSESGFEGGATVNLTTYETAEELISAYNLSDIDFGGKYLRAYSFDVVSEGITIANNNTEAAQTVNVKLTADGINSTENLKLYAVRQGALVALDYQVVDGKFVFNCELSDVVVFVEEMEEKSFNWSVLVWSLVGLLVVGAVIGIVLYFDVKNKKKASKKTTKKTAKKSTK